MGKFQDKLDSIDSHIVAKIRIFEWLMELALDYSNTTEIKSVEEFRSWFEEWFA